MSTNQKWSFALNLLICFKKRIVNFDNWGNWPLKQIFFPKIVKIKGIIPKFHFFLKKQSKICCSQKNPKKQQQKTKQKTKKQQRTKQKNNSRKQNKKERKTTKNKTKNNKKQQKTKQKTKKTNKQTNKKQVHMHFFRKYSMFRRSIPLKVDKAIILLLFTLNNRICVKLRHYYEY